MADFGNVPTLTTLYTDVLAGFRDRDASLLRMLDGTTDTNVPVGAKRWNEAATPPRFEKWNGTSWSVLDAAMVNHILITGGGNPHGTTAADVGAPTQVAFDAHLADTNNPHSTTAAQLGAATVVSLNAHASRTDNPHAVTAAQVGALARASNLSDLTNATTARANLSVPSLTDFNNHVAAVNPHGLTRATIGAAAAGANSDITSLSQCNSVSSQSGGGGLILNATAGHVLIHFGGTTYLRLQTNTITPVNAAQIMDLGSPGGVAFNNLYFKGKLLRTSGSAPWAYFAYNSAIGSLDPNAATARNCADAINKIFAILETYGAVN